MLSTITRRAAIAALTALTPGAAYAQDTRLYFLSGPRVMTCEPNGSDLRTLATSPRGGINDGLAYDPPGRRLYWTNMGRAGVDDGFIQSVRLDGSDLRMVVPPGGTFTPKQLKIDAGKLYWSDREGMRVMRANLDGSGVETLVQTGSGDTDRRDPARWCVGVAVDPPGGRVYWTQKGGDNAGQGSIRRARLELPAGQTPADRTDVEVLFSRLSEPIDLEIDPLARRLYWTDRGDNTISSAPLDAGGARRPDRTVLVRDVGEAIGIALDLPAKRMFFTSLGGEVGVAGLDGAGRRRLLEGQGLATGIVLAP